MKYSLSVKRNRISENLPELYVNGKHVGILDAVSFLYEMVEEYQKKILSKTGSLDVSWEGEYLPVKAVDQHGIKYICLNEKDARAISTIILISELNQEKDLQEAMTKLSKWLKTETESELRT